MSSIHSGDDCCLSCRRLRHCARSNLTDLRGVWVGRYWRCGGYCCCGCCCANGALSGSGAARSNGGDDPGGGCSGSSDGCGGGLSPSDDGYPSGCCRSYASSTSTNRRNRRSNSSNCRDGPNYCGGHLACSSWAPTSGHEAPQGHTNDLTCGGWGEGRSTNVSCCGARRRWCPQRSNTPRPARRRRAWRGPSGSCGCGVSLGHTKSRRRWGWGALPNTPKGWSSGVPLRRTVIRGSPPSGWSLRR